MINDTIPNVSKIAINGFICYAKRKGIEEDEELIKELVYKANQRLLTQGEIFNIMNDLELLNDSKAEEIFQNHLFATVVRKDLTIKDIAKMNYLETINFVDSIKEKGKEQTNKFLEEIFNLFSSGHIFARDLQYVFDIVGYHMPNDFYDETVKRGRYVNDLGQFGSMHD